MVKEVILISGLSVIGDVETKEEKVVIREPLIVAVDKSGLVLVPLSKTGDLDKIEVKKELVLGLVIPDIEVLRAYNSATSKTIML